MFQIEVSNPRDKLIKFGALRIGQTAKRSVPIVNNSAAPLTFRVGVTPSAPALQASGVLRVAPSQEVTLQPRGGSTKVDVVFAPKARITPFTEEVSLAKSKDTVTVKFSVKYSPDDVPWSLSVLKSTRNRLPKQHKNCSETWVRTFQHIPPSFVSKMKSQTLDTKGSDGLFQVVLESAGLYQPLFVLSGSCQGLEVSLDSNSVPFGAVVQKSSSSRRLIMFNTGDMGARCAANRRN